jgi:hypothetical protein
VFDIETYNFGIFKPNPTFSDPLQLYVPYPRHSFSQYGQPPGRTSLNQAVGSDTGSKSTSVELGHHGWLAGPGELMDCVLLGIHTKS